MCEKSHSLDNTTIIIVRTLNIADFLSIDVVDGYKVIVYCTLDNAILWRVDGKQSLETFLTLGGVKFVDLTGFNVVSAQRLVISASFG